MMTEKLIQQIEQEMEETKKCLVSQVKMMEKNDIENQRRELCNEFVEDADKRIVLNLQAQDKVLLTISSALFGLVTFLLESSQNSFYLTCLVGILLGFNALSLVSALLSLYFGTKDIEKSIEYAEKCYLEEQECFCDKKSCYYYAAKISNTLSLFSLMVAIISLAILLAFI